MSAQKVNVVGVEDGRVRDAITVGQINFSGQFYCPGCKDSPKKKIPCPGTERPCKAEITKDDNYCGKCKKKIDKEWFGEDSSIECQNTICPCNFPLIEEYNMCPVCGFSVNKKIFRKCNAVIEGVPCNGSIIEGDLCCRKCGHDVPRATSTHRCSVKRNRDQLCEIKEEVKSLWMLKNVKPVLMSIMLSETQDELCRFATLLDSAFGAFLDSINGGSLVFTFLHETMECAKRMVNNKSRVKEHFVHFLKELDCSELYDNLNIEVEIKTETQPYGGSTSDKRDSASAFETDEVNLIPTKRIKPMATYTEAELQSLKHNIKLFEMENASKEKMIYLLNSGDRQDKYRHLSREFETLKLFDISFQGLVSVYHLPESFALDVLQVKHSTSGEGERFEAEDYAGHVVNQLKLGIRGRKDLFPILADMTKQVKSIIPSLQAKLDFLERATSNKPPMKGLGNKAEISLDPDVPSMEHMKHGEETNGQHKTDSTRSPNTDTDENPVGQRTEKTGGQHKTRSTRSPNTDTEENPVRQHGEKTDGQHGLESTNSPAVEKQKYSQVQESKTGETGAMAVDVSNYTDSKKMTDLMERLESLKKEADSKKRELAKLREATDSGVEWEYNIGCLAEEMSTLKIQEIVTDVIGEDELPVQTEKRKRPTVFLVGDRITMTPEVRQSQIYYLREREYGTLKGRHILDILKNVIKDDQSRLTNLRTQSDHLECVYGSPIHMVGEIDTDHGGPVSCPPVTFNRELVFKELAVSGDGLKLVNWSGRSLDHRTDRFKKYWGTSSHLPIPLPPSPFTLTAATYWETHTRLQVKKDVSWYTLLEMAVCGEGEVDTDFFVSFQSRSSWGLRVGSCYKHPGLCTQVWENGEQVGECYDTMSPTPGTDVTLKYGIILDVGRGRLAFIDVNRGRVLHKFYVNFRESLFPMFSVWPEPDDFHATMRLISGLEVAMTGEKQQLIAQALFCK